MSTYTHRLIAVVFTFGISGAIHDLAVTLIFQEMYVFYTLLFAFYGVLISVESIFLPRKFHFPKYVRPLYHIALIAGAYLLFKQLIN